MIEEPRTNIEVRMTIPSQTYYAAAQEIMVQYSDLVKETINEIKEDLMFDEEFQEEVKNCIREQTHEVFKRAIKSAAQNVVWDMYGKKSMDIERIVREAILSTIEEK